MRHRLTHRTPRTRLLRLAALLTATSLSAQQPDPAPLRLVRTITLPGVEGRIDHLACLPGDHLLFVAALGNDSLEVVDLEPGRVRQSVGGLHEPQGIALAPSARIVVVACGGDGAVVAFDTATGKERNRRDVGDDADNVRLCPDGKTVLVGHGDGAVTRLDLATLEPHGSLTFGGHPESFQLLPGGGRALVNVPAARLAGADAHSTGAAVLVLDLGEGDVAATWPLSAAGRNYPMALDTRHGVALVGCRAPARLLSVDFATGKVVHDVACVGDADDIFVDEHTGLAFVVGGEGAVDVFAYTADDGRRAIARVPTRAGARTGLLVPELRRLFVAVPQRGDAAAEVREFAIDG